MPVIIVAASSWFHSPRRLAISHAASSAKAARQLGIACGSYLRIRSEAADVCSWKASGSLEAGRNTLQSEEERAAQTKKNNSSLALTWIQREIPVRCAAAIGIEAPAMKPATQAVACSASTSELRQRIGSRSPGSEGSVSPGRWIGVRSGVSRLDDEPGRDRLAGAQSRC